MLIPMSAEGRPGFFEGEFYSDEDTEWDAATLDRAEAVHDAFHELSSDERWNAGLVAARCVVCDCEASFAPRVCGIIPVSVRVVNMLSDDPYKLGEGEVHAGREIRSGFGWICDTCSISHLSEDGEVVLIQPVWA